MIGKVWMQFKMWIAGYSRWSSCAFGMHRWDMPGGHCEECGKCDEFFGPHDHGGAA